MKRFTFTIAAILVAISCFAGDIVTLNNHMVFEGKITNLGGIIKRVDSERELQKFRLKIG